MPVSNKERKLKAGQLTAIEFSQQMILTRDLDPTYCVLWEAKLEPELRDKFLLAYLCFYHFGTASWICSQPDYWKALAAAAATAEHPRASERRHFRGEQAVRAVRELTALRQTPSEVVLGWKPPGLRPKALEVMQCVRRHRGFGPWVAFKAADLLERLGVFSVQFVAADVFNMYESPRLGAELVAKQQGVGKEEACGYALRHLSDALCKILAPPRYERVVNIQEIETCLCKYLSYWNGHYKLGQDIIEVKHAIERYGKLELSQRLLKAGKKAELW